MKKAKREPIYFTNDDSPRGPTPHRDALVIAFDIRGMVIFQVLIDTGTSVNIMYYDTFVKLSMKMDQLKPIRTSLSRFTRDSIKFTGSMILLVEIDTYLKMQKMDMKFIVVRLSCTHNVILV